MSHFWNYCSTRQREIFHCLDFSCENAWQYYRCFLFWLAYFSSFNPDKFILYPQSHTPSSLHLSSIRLLYFLLLSIRPITLIYPSPSLRTYVRTYNPLPNLLTLKVEVHEAYFSALKTRVEELRPILFKISRREIIVQVGLHSTLHMSLLFFSLHLHFPSSLSSLSLHFTSLRYLPVPRTSFHPFVSAHICCL